LEKRFFSELWKSLPTVGKQERNSIEAQARSLIKEFSQRPRPSATDRATRQHLELAVLVLSAYRVLLKAGVHYETTLLALENALLKPNSWIIKTATKTMLATTNDPMTRLVNYTKANIPRKYGAGFEFAMEGNHEHEFTMRVKKCLYNDYFNEMSAPELTPLFCAWDQNWIEPISPKRHRVQFERKTTLADGGESCPFTFRRTEKQ